MSVESRDSVSLKPAELDEFGQLLSAVGLSLTEEQLDQHVEAFPLIAVSAVDSEIHGFLFGSLVRIGGTPCILWGLGAAGRGLAGRAHVERLVGEPSRTAAGSLPGT